MRAAGGTAPRREAADTLGASPRQLALAILGLRSPQQRSRDDHPLDLVCAFVNLCDLRVSHHSLYWVIRDVPITAANSFAIAAILVRSGAFSSTFVAARYTR